MWMSRNGKWLCTRGQASYLSLLFEFSESKCFTNKSSTEFYSFVWVSFYFSLSMSPKCQSMWTFQLFSNGLWFKKRRRRRQMCKQVFHMVYNIHTYHIVSCSLTHGLSPKHSDNQCIFLSAWMQIYNTVLKLWICIFFSWMKYTEQNVLKWVNMIWWFLLKYCNTLNTTKYFMNK